MRVLAEGEVAAGTQPMPTGIEAWIQLLMPIILLVAVFYFMIIRPQRKRDKQTRDMLAALKVGDSIVTIGGIVGKIARIKDDKIVVETTKDGMKIEMERWAIKDVTTVKDA